MASRVPRLAALLAAIACLWAFGCRVGEEGSTVHVSLEVVGREPSPGSSLCSGPLMWWLTKRVDGSDVNVAVEAFADDIGEVEDGGTECIWRPPAGPILGPVGRYRIVATDGEWLAVCPNIVQLFLPQNGQAFHRIRFHQGQPGCMVSIGP